MKGVIADCLGKLVKDKFGVDKWEKSLENAGMNTKTVFIATQDIPDSDVMKLVGSVCKILNITLQQAADAFGDYWVNEYAKKVYFAYFSKSKTAKDFLLNMDKVHISVTQNVKNAKPPRFEYTWENDKTLIMKYLSSRGLIDFLVGLIKGVGKYFNENLTVSKVGSDRVKIVFA